MFRLLFLILPLLVLGPAAAEEKSAPEPFPVKIGGPFSLTDHRGRAVTEKDFLGRHQIIYFGYTSCPDICPIHLQRMTEVIDALGPEGEKLQPLFITVDPERDDVARMADYVTHFHPRMIGLTGEPRQVVHAAKAFRVHARKVKRWGQEDYWMDHSPFLYLLGPKGEFLTLLSPDQDPEILRSLVAKYLG